MSTLLAMDDIVGLPQIHTVAFTRWWRAFMHLIMCGEGSWQKGASINLHVSDLGSSGDAVGRFLGRVVFVRNGVPGDRLAVRLIQVKKNLAQGRLEKVLEASSNRVVPPCPVADKCGGCQWQCVDYSLQLEIKRNQVVQAISRIGKLSNVDVKTALPSEPFGYRNKVSYPFSRSALNGACMGYYEKGTHDVVDIEHCPVQDVRLDPVLATVKRDMLESGWPIYDGKKHKGDIRHLSLRIGHHTGQILLTIVSTKRRLPGIKQLAQSWMADHPNIVGVCININSRKTKEIFGSETFVVRGQPFLVEKFMELDLRLASTTFFQVNTVQAERVVGMIIEELDLRGDEVLLDAYCGIGTIALPLASRLPEGQVLGVEIMEESIEQATTNARENSINNVNFEVGRVETVLPRLIRGGGFNPEVVIIDPPRKGCDAAVLDCLLEAGPDRIVYVSCNPATLARDLQVLCGVQGSYDVQKIVPADFFPQTSHVETVAFLKQRN
ncbi:hypothetical protein BSKO_03319 [Bryopsis sp. KO-2023]|nr:hypothetical protein BSKO_03319 [Bryopsis sp. KO-2023]